MQKELFSPKPRMSDALPRLKSNRFSAVTPFVTLGLGKAISSIRLALAGVSLRRRERGRRVQIAATELIPFFVLPCPCPLSSAAPPHFCTRHMVGPQGACVAALANHNNSPPAKEKRAPSRDNTRISWQLDYANSGAAAPVTTVPGKFKGTLHLPCARPRSPYKTWDLTLYKMIC